MSDKYLVLPVWIQVVREGPFCSRNCIALRRGACHADGQFEDLRFNNKAEAYHRTQNCIDNAKEAS